MTTSIWTPSSWRDKPIVQQPVYPNQDALQRAARTGEMSFESLISTIASDLARLGAGAVIDQIVTGIGGALGAGPPVSINVTMPEGADAGSLISAQGQIASALSQAVLSGARWS